MIKTTQLSNSCNLKAEQVKNGIRSEPIGLAKRFFKLQNIQKLFYDISEKPQNDHESVSASKSFYIPEKVKKTTEDVLWNIKNSEKSHNVKKLTGSRFSETEKVSEKRCIAEDKQTVYFIML